MTYSKESLTAMRRSELIQLAIKSGSATPSQAYSTKTVNLIDAVLAKHAPSAPEVVEVETSTAEAVEQTPVAVAQAEDESEDNVVPFDAPAPLQTEIPAEKEVSGKSLGIFKINRKVFLAQLSAATKCVDGKPSMPILGNALIEFGNGRLSVGATNLDCWIKTDNPAETNGAATITVPARLLQAFVSKCTSENLMGEVMSSHRFKISDLTNKTELMGIGPEDFPVLPTVDGTPLFTITGKRLAKALIDVEKCQSTDQTRYILNGVAIVTTEPAAELVATDGRRLCKVPLGAETVAENPTKERRIAILPAKAVSLLIGTLPKDATINAIQTARGIAFVAANAISNFEVYSKVVEGNFPNFQQVIPKEPGTMFTVKADEFMAALERVTVLITEKSNSVKLTFSGQKLQFDTASPDSGVGTEPISATSKTDAPESVVVAVNPDFLLEIIGSWKPETFTIAVKDEVSPILLGSEERLAVVMPVRLS